MRWMLIILLVLSASAAKFDIDAPGFWSKSYSIPRSYCERHITLSSPRPDKIVKAAAPCEFTTLNGHASSDCRLSAEQADKLAASLRKLGTLVSYSQNCDPAPANPELYYKRENLTREYEALKLPRAELPGVSGLMIAQLATLNNLIASHEAALLSNLAIDVLNPDAASTVVDEQFPRVNYKRAVKKIKLDGGSLEAVTGGWARQSQLVCGQIDPVVAVYGRRGPEQDAKLLAKVRALGEPYSAPECAQGGETAAVIFSLKSEAAIRRILTDLPELRSWSRETRGRIGVLVPDDRRFDELSAEAASHSAELEQAPHVRALVAAEIARVRDNAAALKKLRKGTLVIVRFAP